VGNGLMTEAHECAINLVRAHKGMRGSRLCAELTNRFPQLEGRVIKKIPATLTISGQLVEVEYLIPGEASESYFLPAGTEIRTVERI